MYVRLRWKDIKMTFTNMYNLNMNSMTGTNLLQSGLNFIGGGNAMGGFGGNFQIGNMLGGNAFTNCYGEVDYDKMAGYQVAGALFSVGAQAYQSVKAQKAPKVDYSKEVSDLNKQIQTKQDDLLNKTTKVTELGTDKLNAENTVKSLQGQKILTQSLESDLATARKAYDAQPTPENKAALDNAEKALNNAKAKNEEIDKEVEKQKKIISDVETKLSALEGEIETLASELKELKTKRDNLQPKASEQTLSKADGNILTRAKKECMNDSYSQDGNQATKAEIKRGFNEFIKCKDPEQKKAYANKIKEMYDSNPKLADKYSQEIKLVDKWLLEN